MASVAITAAVVGTLGTVAVAVAVAAAAFAGLLQSIALASSPEILLWFTVSFSQSVCFRLSPLFGSSLHCLCVPSVARSLAAM